MQLHLSPVQRAALQSLKLEVVELEHRFDVTDFVLALFTIAEPIFLMWISKFVA